MRIAIQGDESSFHHIAAKKYFGEDIEIVPCETFADVFASLANGESDNAVVAYENSWYGKLPEVTELLDQYRFPAVGELSESIHQNLVTLPNVALTDIKTVLSHPVALKQCSKFLKKQLPKAELREHHDTAAAVEYIMRRADPSIAAIASDSAADLHGLPILAENIENDPNNTTRFMILAPR